MQAAAESPFVPLAAFETMEQIRTFLRGKAAQGVHSVSMSATPIPRSIAVAMYGEGTEVVNIRTLPNGRKPVKTILYRAVGIG